MDDLGYLLHITDAHIDVDYSPGSPTKCVLGSTGLGCCRKYDIPLSGYRPASPWGEKTCDAPPQLLNQTLAWIKDNLPLGGIDAILYGGDSVGHHDITQGYQRNVNTANLVTNMFRQHFPSTPFLPNQGNHDTYPIDQVLPEIGKNFRRHLADGWNHSIGTEASNLFAERGYYSYPLNSRVTVVSMSSILYDSHNLFKIHPHPDDPQVVWFDQLLSEARQNSSHLLLLGHIFPGAGESTPKFNAWLTKILQENQDVLHNGIFGHSHSDQWVIIPPNATNITRPPAVALVTPSMMPDQRDPSFRIYKYRRSTGELVDYQQYYVDLESTISQNQVQVRFDYSFQQEYQKPDLSGNSLWELYHTMNYCPQVADRYCRHYWGTGNTTGSCAPVEVELLLANQIVKRSPDSS